MAAKFSAFQEHWSPKIVGEVNGHQVKLAKLKGSFVWHQHDHEDELFMVLKGRLVIRLEDQPDLVLEPGEFAVIPKGVRHCPVAEEEVQLMLLEPATTVNTGAEGGSRTRAAEWL
jgi:mannose-6-phosphate isomerase-like protein (cupin superfamily)